MRTREEVADDATRYYKGGILSNSDAVQIELQLDCRDLLIAIRDALTARATPDPISSLNRMKDRYE